jgi:2,3-bisphosphoglycerate-independent phosphoglycerate mutase
MLAQYEKFEEFLVSFKNVEVTTISGRFYAMDRDNNWDRVKRAYDVMCFADDKTGISSKDYIKQSYLKEIYDEFLEPINFTGKNI